MIDFVDTMFKTFWEQDFIDPILDGVVSDFVSSISVIWRLTNSND